MPPFARALGAMAVLASFAGCGFVTEFDSFTIARDATVATPYDDFVAALAVRVCDRARFCESKLATAAEDQAACGHVPGSPSTSLFEHYLAHVAPAARERFDASSASACLAAVVTNRCDVATLPRECAFLSVGTSTIGSFCNSDDDCGSGRCEGTTLACGSRTCVALGASSAPCLALDDCEVGLRCVSGTCAAPTPQGAACGTRDECDEGLWCDAIDGTGSCEPAPDQELEPCTIDDGRDPCANSLVCVNGACARAAAVGASCGASIPCEPGARCVTGICRAIGLRGDACVSRNDCPSFFDCVDDLCVPRPVEGEACDPARACSVGACESNVCIVRDPGASCVDAAVPYAPRCHGYCDDAFVPPRCTETKLDGVGCADDLECTSGSCVGDPVRSCTVCE